MSKRIRIWGEKHKLQKEIFNIDPRKRKVKCHNFHSDYYTAIKQIPWTGYKIWIFGRISLNIN